MTDAQPPSDLTAALALDPALDGGRFADAFRRHGRLHLPSLLTEDAARGLHAQLAAERLWVCSTIGGGVVADVPVEMLQAMSDAQRTQFLSLAHAEARDGFHYMFDSVRITDPLERGQDIAPAYRAIHDFLNGEAFLGLIRDITGDERPAYVDSQATRFLPGHYLTRHDDRKPTASRLYAYVLNLTPRWRADWGGLLNFLDEDGHVAEAYTPAWNALNLFRVPQPHSVGFVAPFAGGARLSITGWIRDDVPPAIAQTRRTVR